MAKDSAVRAAPKQAKAKARPSKNVDPTEARVAEATEWLTKHWRQLAIGGGVLVVVLGTVLGYRAHSRSQSERAARLLADAIAIATADIGEPPEDDPQPSERMYKTHRARAQAALRAFRAAVTALPTGEIGARAKLGEANALFDLRKFAEAQRAYQESRSLAEDDRDVAAQALQGVAFCLEAQHKAAEAMRIYEELGRLGDDYRSLAEYHQARLHIEAGRRDRALSLLKGIRTRLTRPPTGRGREEDDETPSPSERYPYLLAQVQARLEHLDPSEAANSAGGGSSPDDIIRRLQQQMGGLGNVKILGGGRPGAGGTKR